MVSSLTAPNKCNQSFTHLAPDLVHLRVAEWLLPAMGPGKEGMSHARVLGEWRYSVLRTSIHQIYASNLKCANSTAVQCYGTGTGGGL